MLTEVLSSSSVQRLQEILRNRYGLGLKIDFMASLSLMDPVSQSPSMTEGDLRIPLWNGGLYLASAIVSNASSLNWNEQNKIVEMIRLVLEPNLYLWALKQREDAEISQRGMHMTNIFADSEPAGLPEKFSDFLSIDFATSDDQSSSEKEVISPAFLLQSKLPFLVTKIASQIHELTGRWAYLRYEDLKDSFSSVEQIQSLGALTILVQDILHLSIDQQAIIGSFIATSTKMEQPLLLLGCTSPFEDLVKDQMIHQSLVTVLASNRLDLDRLPQNSEQLAEALELILDRKSVLN